jgi:hypothetical protein
MNDRFDLQLRQHLLKTADDRPAAGQLAAIVERVAARAQRRPIVARLVFPGRLGSAPSTSLGYAFIALALIGALLAAAALGAGAPRPVPAATSPAPTASSEPLRSPAPGFSTFESTVHGISIDYPAGWQTRPATEPWTRGELTFDSPEADVIFDPAHGPGGLYILLASQPYGSVSADAWRDGVLAWTCPNDGGHDMWGWHVDGAYSFQLGPCNSGSIVQADSRGYLIRVVTSSDQPALAATYNWDWLKPLLETVDLRPEDAINP